MILQVKDICAAYVGLSDVLFGVNLELEQGEVVALMGRNGVGKTTTFRAIMGLTPPKSGKVVFKGQDITGNKPYQIAQLGLGLVPGDRQIFPDLTVWENLDVGRRNQKEGGWTFEKVFGLFPSLERYQKRRGGNLSGGEQQMLAIARTLMGNPELVLMDEPSEGLAPLLVKDLKNQILRLRDEGETILLAEQNFQFCLETCSRAYVLEKGQVVWQGLMEDLRDNDEVKSRYLLL
jgi:branched-chain amino acid transport system ATP-binding protein